MTTQWIKEKKLTKINGKYYIRRLKIANNSFDKMEKNNNKKNDEKLIKSYNEQTIA